MDLLKLTEGEICLKILKNKNKGINKCSLKKKKRRRRREGLYHIHGSNRVAWELKQNVGSIPFYSVHSGVLIILLHSD